MVREYRLSTANGEGVEEGHIQPTVFGGAEWEVEYAKCCPTDSSQEMRSAIYLESSGRVQFVGSGEPNIEGKEYTEKLYFHSKSYGGQGKKNKPATLSQKKPQGL